MTTIGSLFAGGGGLDRGVELALAADVRWQVELGDYPRSILERYWPDAGRDVTDVRKASRTTLSPVDVIIGGFPCQDLSPAGSRKGLAGARSGLAFEMLRVVEELAPRLLITENTYHRWRAWVPELRRRLWALGYASVPLHVSAAEVGAPHRRSRAFVVAWRGGAGPYAAYAGGEGRRPAPRSERPSSPTWNWETVSPARLREAWASTDADRLALRQLAERGPRGWEGLVRRKGQAEPGHDGGARPAPDADVRGRGEQRQPGGEPEQQGARGLQPGGRRGARAEAGPLAPPVAGGWWAPVPGVRRGDDGVAGVDVRARRRRDRQRLTLLGNAVVPQVAYVVGIRAKELLLEAAR